MKFVQIYNPREDSFEVLSSLLVGRDAILEEILADLRRQNHSRTRQHWLIRGLRGIGKTHLMAMIYHKVRTEPDLSVVYQPVWLSEKTAYEIYSAGWFLDRIAWQLARELGQSPVAAKIERARNELYAEGDDPHLFDAMLDVLKKASQELGKKLVVIVENLDSLLNAFSARKRNAEAQRIRSVMQHDHELLFIGTTPTHDLPGLADPKKPIFGLFRERALAPLTEGETEMLFDALADTYGQADKKDLLRVTSRQLNRRRVFHRLTGGNPRSVVMAFHVVAGVPTLEGMVDDLRSLLDAQTAYYEARLAKLAPRERVIVGALSSSETNLTAQEIARATRLPERSISTQLGRLAEEGHVNEVAATGGKGTVYEVSDGLFRLWYQFREGRQLLAPIVRFLSYWHSPEELTSAIGALSAELAGTRSSLEAEGRHLALAHIEEAYRFQTSDAGRAERERFFADQNLYLATSLERADQTSELTKARALLSENRDADVIDLLEAFHPEDPVAAAEATLLIAFAQGRRGNTEVAIPGYRDLIERFGKRDEVELASIVARAMVNLGATLGSSGRADEAIDICRQLIARFADRDETALQEQVAMAMVNLGVNLGHAGHADEEINTYRHLIARFAERDETVLKQRVAMAFVNLGWTLEQQGRTGEAVTTHRSNLERFRPSRDEVIEQVMLFSRRLLISLLTDDQRDEAVAIGDELVSSIARRVDRIPLNDVMGSLQLLLRTFEEHLVRNWLTELESLGDSRGVANLARLHRFVVDVLEGSQTKSKRDEGLAARKRRALRRVPPEIRQTVEEMADDILRARRASKPRSRKKKAVKRVARGGRS